MTGAPSETPDRGYIGDRARGASLGRASRGAVESPGERLHLRGIRLDSGGYDPGGAYWGHGGWLWEAWNDAGDIYLTGRAMHGSAERKATYQRLRDAGYAGAGELPRRPNLSAWIDRETAKDAVREIVGHDVRFYR